MVRAEKKSLMRRCLAILPAVPVMTSGVILFTKAGWGTDPFTSFEMGLAKLLSLSLGNAALLFEGVCFFIFLAIRRRYIHFGTAAFCFGAGPCLDLASLWVEALFPSPGLAARFFCAAVGSLFIVTSLAYYVQIDLGFQSLDMLSMLAADLTGRSYGFGLSIVYIVLTALAFLMGVSPGIGTVISAVGFGFLVNIVRPLIRPLVCIAVGEK